MSCPAPPDRPARRPGPGRPPAHNDQRLARRNLMLLTLHSVLDQPIEILADAFGLDRRTVRNGIQSALAAAGRRDPLVSLAEDIHRLQTEARHRNHDDQADDDEAPEDRDARILRNARRRRRPPAGPSTLDPLSRG